MANGSVPLIDPGGGGVDAAGPAARLWRNVYKKAAQAAEARLLQLLAEHVYQGHGLRALSIILDGGGVALAAGVRCDLELPWAYVLEGWALYAGAPAFDPLAPPAAGWSLVLDLKVATNSTTFPDFASITGGSPPALDVVDFPQAARDLELEDWTVALPRGRVLRVEVVSAESVALATLTLFLRAV